VDLQGGNSSFGSFEPGQFPEPGRSSSPDGSYAAQVAKLGEFRNTYYSMLQSIQRSRDLLREIAARLRLSE
jgi:hypothetical protein